MPAAAARDISPRFYTRAVKVLLVGGGGREHALAWALSQSASLSELHAAPGNPGIASLGHCHAVQAEDGEGMLALAQELAVGLVVVGPEAPLVAGLADSLRRAGIGVFGPGEAAARLEGSKAFAKDVMRAAGVATAESLPIARPPCVLKADGLAAGKGVFVCHDQSELREGLDALRARGGRIVVEELLEGREVSLLALTDGERAIALPPAQDSKRLEDGDRGPNTGGMGSYSPVPGLGPEQVEALLEAVHRPVLQELAARGSRFSGVLYAGLMLTERGPKVLEFNCRFGDPETQSILPRIEGDLLDALAAAATGDLRGVSLPTSDRAAVTVVLAAPGYPETGDHGSPIAGVAEAAADGALVFHAGTAMRNGTLVTAGGRVLGVTARGQTLAEAREAAYGAAAHVSFSGARFRRDIAAAASAPRERVHG